MALPKSKKTGGGFTVSGPGIDRDGYAAGLIGLSAAITLASKIRDGETVYVRDPDGAVFGRVERVSAKGDLRVYGNGARS